MTRGEQVKSRMSGQYPEPVVLSAKGLYGCPFGHVPNANRLVFSIRQNEFVAWVEQTCRDVVEVSTARIDLPSLGIRHPPELDLTVITTRNDEREGRMEGSPVDAAIMLNIRTTSELNDQATSTQIPLTPSKTYLTWKQASSISMAKIMLQMHKSTYYCISVSEQIRLSLVCP
jgi:hypothetical protein